MRQTQEGGCLGVIEDTEEDDADGQPAPAVPPGGMRIATPATAVRISEVGGEERHGCLYMILDQHHLF